MDGLYWKTLLIKMYDLGGTIIFGNTHIYIYYIFVSIQYYFIYIYIHIYCMNMYQRESKMRGSHR